jgi:hypothetical protein
MISLLLLTLLQTSIYIYIYMDQDPLEFLRYSTTWNSLNPNFSFYNK